MQKMLNSIAHYASASDNYFLTTKHWSCAVYIDMRNEETALKEYTRQTRRLYCIVCYKCVQFNIFIIDEQWCGQKAI